MGGYGSSYSYNDRSNKSTQSYNISHGREYDMDDIERRERLLHPVNKVLHTEALFPVVIAVDVTGSMKKWPGIIFEKLCVLYNEALLTLPEELKESFEISFAAIGDAYTDSHPLQITDFDKETALDENIKKLFPEGRGGGQTRETYELAAYYYAKHCEMPRALSTTKPIFIFIGDEGYYSRVKKEHIKRYIGDEVGEDLPSEQIFGQLAELFTVYILRIKYPSPIEVNIEGRIQKDWQRALGPEKAIIMEHPERIVDLILGLIAGHVGEFNAFAERISVRQTPEQVQQVLETLSETDKNIIDRLGVKD